MTEHSASEPEVAAPASAPGGGFAPARLPLPEPAVLPLHFKLVFAIGLIILFLSIGPNPVLTHNSPYALGLSFLLITIAGTTVHLAFHWVKRIEAMEQAGLRDEVLVTGLEPLDYLQRVLLEPLLKLTRHCWGCQLIAYVLVSLFGALSDGTFLFLIGLILLPLTLITWTVPLHLLRGFEKHLRNPGAILRPGLMVGIGMGTVYAVTGFFLLNGLLLCGGFTPGVAGCGMLVILLGCLGAVARMEEKMKETLVQVAAAYAEPR